MSNFIAIYNQFIKLKNIDTIVIDKKRVLKAEAKTLIHGKEEQYKSIIEKLNNETKNVEINNLSCTLQNPFDILNFNSLSSVQKSVIKHSESFYKYGSYAYSCSCGSGKTLAGIYLIHKFNCKTLIITSRNAVKDQWMGVLMTLYKDLIVETKDGLYRNNLKLKIKQDADVYFYSPQYISGDVSLEKIEHINPSLIIYDEVHSLLSDKFIKVLTFPMANVISGKWGELPYMIALSATYPEYKSKEYGYIYKLFGKAYKTTSTITSIPVHVYDYYDHCEVDHGRLDKDYIKLDEYDCVKYFMKHIFEHKEYDIDIYNNAFKGIVITDTIDSSVYNALYLHKEYNIDVLLIRSIKEDDIYLPKDKFIDYEFDRGVTLADLLKNNIGVRCFYKHFIDKCNIIVGTVDRLKEGFSVENITWGICTQFVWSTIARAQILGRVRRNSDNEELNNKYRIMFVNSAKCPSNDYIVKKKSIPIDATFTYNKQYEEAIFQLENYIRI